MSIMVGNLITLLLKAEAREICDSVTECTYVSCKDCPFFNNTTLNATIAEIERGLND